jgi:hypothetical protein
VLWFLGGLVLGVFIGCGLMLAWLAAAIAGLVF